MVRQMILFRAGQRSNPEAEPMRLEASQLSLRDMISVAAYAASLKPESRIETASEYTFLSGVRVPHPLTWLRPPEIACASVSMPASILSAS
jgi:cytochrome c553